MNQPLLRIAQRPRIAAPTTTVCGCVTVKVVSEAVFLAKDGPHPAGSAVPSNELHLARQRIGCPDFLAVVIPYDQVGEDVDDEDIGAGLEENGRCQLKTNRPGILKYLHRLVAVPNEQSMLGGWQKG